MSFATMTRAAWQRYLELPGLGGIPSAFLEHVGIHLRPRIGAGGREGDPLWRFGYPADHDANEPDGHGEPRRYELVP